MRLNMKRAARSAAVVLLAVALTSCATKLAFRQGQKAAEKGEWDLAVARYTKALDGDRDNIGYKLALENARIQASRFHLTEARKHLAAEEYEKAVDSLEIATKYDAANKSAADDMALVKARIARRNAEREQRAGYQQLKTRVAPAARPFLSARSNVPIALKFTDTPISKVFEALSKLSGVNILIDPDYRADKRVTIDLRGLNFEESMDRITYTNRLFYKVIDSNTVIVATESPAKRRVYDDLMIQTFYIDNAEANEVLQQVKALTQITKASANPASGAITIVATPDKLAMAERIILANDKAKGEVLVEVEIIEVDREKIRDYGLRLSSYEASSTLSPTGAEGEVADGFTNIRAHLLSSLNLSDFILRIPSTLTAKFLQSESNTKILAAPRLRAAEGKKTTLKIGEEIPIPVTTFFTQPVGTPSGGANFQPTTSFQFRNVGITMDLTPKISASGDIALEMNAEFSLLGTPQDVGNGTLIPSFLTRQVSGVLRLRDGETTYIGGLLQSQETSGFTGIAGIPLLSKFVSPNEKRKTTREVIISLTPHLVRAPKVTEDDLTALSAGTEEVVRMRSARTGRFGSPEAEPDEPAPSPIPDSVPPPVAPPPPAQVPEEPRSLFEDQQQPLPGAAEPSTPISATVSPAERVLLVGDTATIDVVVMGVRDLRGINLVLRFDPDLVSVTDVVAGSLLTLDGQSVAVEKAIDHGGVTVRFTRAAGTSGSGSVASLRVQGVKAGSTDVVVQSLTIETGAGPQLPAVPMSARLVVQQ